MEKDEKQKVKGTEMSYTIGKYILIGQTVVPCDDLIEWAKWFETADTLVFQTSIGRVRVTTVFLGVDFNIFGGPLELFQTMISGGDLEWETWRYPDWMSAEEGHRRAVATVQEACQKKRSR